MQRARARARVNAKRLMYTISKLNGTLRLPIVEPCDISLALSIESLDGDFKRDRIWFLNFNSKERFD